MDIVSHAPNRFDHRAATDGWLRQHGDPQTRERRRRSGEPGGFKSMAQDESSGMICFYIHCAYIYIMYVGECVDV